MGTNQKLELKKSDRQTRPPQTRNEGKNIDYEKIYKNEIPDFVEENLERLYSNIYCTLTRIDAYESLDHVSTYVRKHGATIAAIILFKDEGHIIRVINEQIPLSPEQIARFCAKIFNEMKHARVIRIRALDTQLGAFPFPYQQLTNLEENIIYFRNHEHSYLDRLDRKFKKKILSSQEKLKASHPTHQIQYLERDAIPLNVVKEILQLARKRMISKGGMAYTDSIDTVALAKTLKKYGHVATITINEKICAGSIWFSVGKRHFHNIVAHDPEYDKYFLGGQIWLTAILRSHELEADEVWLMGGFSDNKAKYCAQPHFFHTTIIYKSRLHILTSFPEVTRLWIRRQRLSVKAAIQKMAKRTD